MFSGSSVSQAAECHCSQRKGIPCRKGIISAYLDGVGVRDQDRVVIVDVVPNRFDA